MDKVQQVISRATRPPPGRTRWSVRTMGKAVGISHDSVRRIWQDHDIKPHLTRTFKLSTDPLFEEVAFGDARLSARGRRSNRSEFDYSE